MNLIQRAQAAVAAFRKASDGDSGDEEYDAACDLRDIVEEFILESKKHEPRP